MQQYLHGDGTQHRGAVQLYPAMQLIASEGSRPGSHVTAGVAASWVVQDAGTFGRQHLLMPAAVRRGPRET
jgi:hypothetical protein